VNPKNPSCTSSSVLEAPKLDDYFSFTIYIRELGIQRSQTAYSMRDVDIICFSFAEDDRSRCSVKFLED